MTSSDLFPAPALARLGWSDFFERQLAVLRAEGNLPASAAPYRVTFESRGLYRVDGGAGELLVELSGRVRHSAESELDLPVSGDWVLAVPMQGTERVLIHSRLERRGLLVRRAAGTGRSAQALAANVDTVFIVAALGADFNARRLERTLALVWDGGANPVIVLSKADLAVDAVGDGIRAAEASAPGVPVHALSSVTGTGVEALLPYVREGSTCVMLGSSGAGKSTLANRLLGHEAQETGAVREHDERGKHTTSARQLLWLPSGAALIDTPGLREVQLLDAEEGLGATFHDVEALATACRFNDCAHQSEPGCAVLTAVENGDLDEARLASYRKLLREQAYLERRDDPAAQAQQRQKWRRISVAARKRGREKRGER